MPHVNIKLYPGRSIEQKKELTNKIIKAMEETIAANSKYISVTFEEIKPEDWDEKVVKPEMVDKKELLFKSPEYKTKYSDLI